MDIVKLKSEKKYLEKKIKTFQRRKKLIEKKIKELKW